MHVLQGEEHNLDAHLSVYFVSPIRHLELPSTPSQILFPQQYAIADTVSIGRMPGMFIGGDLPSQGFHQTWMMPLATFYS